MAFKLKTITELTEMAREGFRRFLPGSDAWIWPNNIYASAKVIGGMTFEVIGYASYISRQIFVATSDRENLIRHAADYGMAPRPAEPAGGPVSFTSAAAMTIDAGAQLRRLDNSILRVSLGGFTAGPGTLTLNVVAVDDGQNGNTEAGTSLEILSGVTSDAVVSAVVSGEGIVGGYNVESTEDLRARVAFRKKYTPMAGAAPDYVRWALEVPGVTRVFVERLFSGPGTVRIFVLMDDLYPNSGGIPSVADIARVQDHIETLRPSGALSVVAAPNPLPVDIVISDFEPASAAARDAAVVELRDAFRRLSRVAGTDTPHPAMPFLAVPTSFSKSWIDEAISTAPNESRHVLSSPTADIAQTTGQIPVIGSITFI